MSIFSYIKTTSVVITEQKRANALNKMKNTQFLLIPEEEVLLFVTYLGYTQHLLGE